MILYDCVIAGAYFLIQMMKITGNECDYLVNPGEYLKSDYGFTLQKDSPLREILDFHTRHDFFNLFSSHGHNHAQSPYTIVRLWEI